MLVTWGTGTAVGVPVSPASSPEMRTLLLVKFNVLELIAVGGYTVGVTPSLIFFTTSMKIAVYDMLVCWVDVAREGVRSTKKWFSSLACLCLLREH